MASEMPNRAINEAAQLSTDIVKATARLAETGLKKAWSIMDAATEKKLLSEYLSQTAIRAIQGIAQLHEN